MEKDDGSIDGQDGKAIETATSDETRPGRPARHIGRRRFLASSLTAGPILLTLGSSHADAQTFPPGTACHSNSLSKLASFHPGTRQCPTTTNRTVRPYGN
jgi:hypothetical protein